MQQPGTVDSDSDIRSELFAKPQLRDIRQGKIPKQRIAAIPVKQTVADSVRCWTTQMLPTNGVYVPTQVVPRAPNGMRRRVLMKNSGGFPFLSNNPYAQTTNTSLIFVSDGFTMVSTTINFEYTGSGELWIIPNGANIEVTCIEYAYKVTT